MKKYLLAAAMFATAFMTFGTIEAQAAPVQMSDGTIFDAEYYAETYPDVAAAFGADAVALYEHYVSFGRKEGRSGYLPGTESQAVPASQTVLATVDNGTISYDFTDPILAAAKAEQVSQTGNFSMRHNSTIDRLDDVFVVRSGRVNVNLKRDTATSSNFFSSTGAPFNFKNEFGFDVSECANQFEYMINVLSKAGFSTDFQNSTVEITMDTPYCTRYTYTLKGNSPIFNQMHAELGYPQIQDTLITIDVDFTKQANPQYFSFSHAVAILYCTDPVTGSYLNRMVAFSF